MMQVGAIFLGEPAANKLENYRPIKPQVVAWADKGVDMSGRYV
jgi:hypothetical protein